MSLNTPDEEDFRDVSWNDEIALAERRSVDKYRSHFFDKAEELEEHGDDESSRAYRFLGDICSMYLKDDDPDEPFGPMMVTANGRTAALDDFSDEDLDLMNYLLGEVDDPELKARIADIIWTIRRDHEAAEIAVHTYIGSAENLLDPESWSTGFKRIERAFEIATMLGNEALRGTLEDYVMDQLDALDGRDPKYLTYRLVELLLEHGLGDYEDLAQRSEEAAEYAEEEGKWRKAKLLWMLKAKIERKHDEGNLAADAEVRAGEMVLEWADETRSRSHAAAASHYADAVEIFRRAGETERADRVHELLLDAQEKATEEMAYIETEIDLTDLATEAREAVSNKEIVEALRILSMIAVPPKIQDLKEEVEGIAEDYPLSALLPQSVVNEDGKTIAKRGSTIGPTAEEEAIMAEVVKHSQQLYNVQVHGKIRPAVEQITREHRIRLRDLIDLCKYNSFVPPGRELVFARGIYRGFQRDFMSSSNLLIPQIEHTIRFHLARVGIITSSLQSDGIQEEYSLNTLLHMEETEELLGEDTVFTLRSLLTSKFGSNFRNRAAHGLLDDDQFGSVPGIYTWWIVLHLVFRPIVAAMEQEGTSDEEDSTHHEE